MVQSTSESVYRRHRIIFCIRAALPGRCGVTDYSIRMACAFKNLGWDALLLDGSRQDGVATVVTSEGSVEIMPMQGFECGSSDVISIQFVPNLSLDHWDWIRKLSRLRCGASHLMMHEFWRVATPKVPLHFREKLRAVPQRIQSEWLRLQLGPDVITTSCEFYQKTLVNAGWPALLTPMPGNMPTNTDGQKPEKLKNVEWFLPENGNFTWVAFGSIYARYWDPGTYFLECRKLADLGGPYPKWVIAGRQSPHDVDVLLRSAEQAGFSRDIEILGPCEPLEIDWLMKNANAQITGVSAVCWDKSGGVLAARERNLPIFAPVDGLGSLADFLANPSQHTAQVVAANQLRPKVNPENSASILASILMENSTALLEGRSIS